MTPVPARLESLSDIARTAAEYFLPRLILALVILVAGIVLAAWAARAVSGALARTGRVDETARPALAAAARYGVLIVTAVAALSQIGVQTASLLAALGAAGLAIGLALQGTLANIAAGIMLLWLRPFRVGDYIETVGGTPFAGTVKEIGLFASRLETYDGLFVFAPNSAIWTSPLRNHSRNAGRLVSFNVGFAPGADIARARAILLRAIADEPGVLKRAARRSVRRQSGWRRAARHLQLLGGAREHRRGPAVDVRRGRPVATGGGPAPDPARAARFPPKTTLRA